MLSLFISSTISVVFCQSCNRIETSSQKAEVRGPIGTGRLHNIFHFVPVTVGGIFKVKGELEETIEYITSHDYSDSFRSICNLNLNI